MSEDFGALADKLKSLLDSGGADSLLGLLNKNEDSKASSNNSDMETLIKLKQAYDKVSSSPDPRISLLSSLKPYMSSKRSAELDRIANIISITKISEIIKTFQGGF